MDPEGFGMSNDSPTSKSTSASILQARGLVKRYGRVVALDNADFDLLPGEILAVIGDNGAGKSSLIRALSGAMMPDAGEIRLNGQQVTFRSPLDARGAGIETVYQTLALSPSLSIADNWGVNCAAAARSVPSAGYWIARPCSASRARS